MSWTDQEILAYWTHPDTKDLIINAVPIVKYDTEIEDTEIEDTDGSESLTSSPPPATTPPGPSTPPPLGPSTPPPPGPTPVTSPHRVSSVKTLARQSRIKIIDDENLTKFPYQSVGRLFVCKPGTNEIHLCLLHWQ